MVEYRYIWLIENYSYCMLKNGERLISPIFTAVGLEGTSWSLVLYPRGTSEINKGQICIFLARCEIDSGPEDIVLKYELSILAADESALVLEGNELNFERGAGFGVVHSPQLDDVLFRRKAEYLPQDTLSICCKIWKNEGNSGMASKIYARTRVGIEHISFFQEVENFNSLNPNVKNTKQIRPPSNEELVLTSNLYFLDNLWCKGKIIVEISLSDTSNVVSRCKFSLLNEAGRLIQCGKLDNRRDPTGKIIQKMALSLTRQEILNKKKEYLKGDKLSSLCECIFSTGVDYEKIEKTLNDIPTTALSQIYDINQKDDVYNTAEKLSACSSAIDDLKSIYNDQHLTDVKIKTKTKIFLAHKVVLCARSAVFRTMLTCDMREKNTDCIQIDDLEENIVQQLLLFLYSDDLRHLKWEPAMKLYYAGDKYAIEKLKVLCSSFLVSNLNTSTASELLLLSDTHNDSHLKEIVENFIMEHEEEVFGSEEWEKLIETSPQLVIKTMHLKYRRKNR